VYKQLLQKQKDVGKEYLEIDKIKNNCPQFCSFSQNQP
jgi:hypothetical protein